MRRPVIGTALLALVLVTAPASADPSEPTTPSHSDVRKAERRAQGAADDVDAIQAQIDAANADLEAAAVTAQQAAEAYNGARWRLGQARQAERQAVRQSRRADRELVRVKQDYRDALLRSFLRGSPDLAELSAALDADGLSSLLDSQATAGIVQAEFEEKRTAYETAATAAADAAQVAQDAAADAAAAADDALQAKQEAESAVAVATQAAQSVATEKRRLLRRLAHLEGISLALAEQRQADLEQQRQEQAALQAQQEQQAEQVPEEPSAEPPAEEPTEEPAEEPPAEEPPADDTDDPPSPPADQGGAAAAVAFARDQLGEPYVWAAAGPDAWDCSGLTMGAWANGGKSLPHYSVAQYEQSTPISSGALQPGDLVFWGSSSSPGSIYHVALYVGDGMIIHAPRTGRPVSLESMYYWIPPNFFARP